MTETSDRRPVRVVLVDDHAMFRSGVRGELAAAQCYEGKGALEDAKKLYSEIIAADATDPPGLDATARLEELGP